MPESVFKSVFRRAADASTYPSRPLADLWARKKADFEESRRWSATYRFTRLEDLDATVRLSNLDEGTGDLLQQCQVWIFTVHRIRGRLKLKSQLAREPYHPSICIDAEKRNIGILAWKSV